jgi:site-specific recombinase XerD
MKKFAKLMKSALLTEPKRKSRNAWLIDQSKCMSMSEVEALKKTCGAFRSQGMKEKKFSLMRTWMLVEFGLQAGLRIGEMAGLRHGNLLIDDTRSSIVVLGKGNKRRAIWISSELKESCLAYLSLKAKLGFENGSSSFVLNNRWGRKISRRSLQKSFKAALTKAGIPTHYYVHCLRHTYATFLLKASNYNYRFVQQQLGHASIQTTQIYASVIESDGREAIEQLYKHN